MPSTKLPADAVESAGAVCAMSAGPLVYTGTIAVPSRNEPDEGEISYPAIFLELEALGYSGWIGCEYKPRGDTLEGLVWTERLGVTL